MEYNNLSSYLKKTYGAPLRKICVDGGFTCPNRDGKVGYGGCIYCGERGAGEHIDGARSIREQVEDGLSRKPSDGVIVYFQNFTNTYADLATLKERYDAALFSDRVRVLDIGTRPDCIDRGICALLASYKEKCDVWVELGLQTANDETAARINRGYQRKVFEDAMALLSEYGLKVIVHLIIGLPGEDGRDVRESVEYLSRFRLFGVKIHSIYVAKGTALAAQYREKSYTPPTEDEYVEAAVDAVARLSPSVIVHRLTGDCPPGLLVAPLWNDDKNRLLERIRKTLSERGLTQGCLYQKTT